MKLADALSPGSIGVAAALVMLWAAICALQWVSPVFLPSPGATWHALVAGFTSGDLAGLTLGTVERMVYGWALASLAGMVESKAVSHGSGKEVLATLVRTGGDPADIVEKSGLAQISDSSELEGIVDRAIELDTRRRTLLGEGDALKAERNATSKQVGEAIKGGAKPDGPEVAALKAASVEAGRKIADLCRTHGISEQTIYTWRRRFGTFQVDDVRRLKQLEGENARLKKMVAERDLEIEVMKEVNAKKW